MQNYKNQCGHTSIFICYYIVNDYNYYIQTRSIQYRQASSQLTLSGLQTVTSHDINQSESKSVYSIDSSKGTFGSL